MKKNPKVGIVIPSYERLKFLKECVQSAIIQTYKNFEIVIVDDCSPSSDIKKYLKTLKDPKVRWYINKTNLGTTKNYDKGMRLLSKNVEWALILDNDDYLDKNCIKEAVKTHLKYPQSKVIHCCQVWANSNKNIFGRDDKYPPVESAENYLLLRTIGKREIRSSSVFFNLKQFEKVGGYPHFPSGMGTDSVLVFSLAFDNKLAFSRKALVYTRIHKKAESETAENLFEKLLSIKMMRNYCQKMYLTYPNHNLHKKQKVLLKAMKYYDRFLNSALLLRKYRELVGKKEPKISTKKSLHRITNFCKKNKIFISKRFRLLVYFFIYFGVNLEKLKLYNYFNYATLKLSKTEKSIRYFLLKKFNIYP